MTTIDPNAEKPIIPLPTAEDVPRFVYAQRIIDDRGSPIWRFAFEDYRLDPTQPMFIYVLRGEVGV
jgi:hypothetical protein